MCRRPSQHWPQTTRRWKLHWQQAQRPEQAQAQVPERVRRREPGPEQAPALPSCHKRPTLRLQSGSPIRAISSFQNFLLSGIEREKTIMRKCHAANWLR